MRVSASVLDSAIMCFARIFLVLLLCAVYDITVSQSKVNKVYLGNENNITYVEHKILLNKSHHLIRIFVSNKYIGPLHIGVYIFVAMHVLESSDLNRGRE